MEGMEAFEKRGREASPYQGGHLSLKGKGTTMKALFKGRHTEKNKNPSGKGGRKGKRKTFYLEFAIGKGEISEKEKLILAVGESEEKRNGTRVFRLFLAGEGGSNAGTHEGGGKSLTSKKTACLYNRRDREKKKLIGGKRKLRTSCKGLDGS